MPRSKRMRCVGVWVPVMVELGEVADGDGDG
jgi:hypothetical protein